MQMQQKRHTLHEALRQIVRSRLFNRHFLLGTIVSIHWLEPAAKNGALLYLLPIVKHESVLNRAADFLLSTRNHLFFVRLNGLGNRDLGVAYAFQAFQYVRYVAYAVIEALAAI